MTYLVSLLEPVCAWIMIDSNGLIYTLLAIWFWEFVSTYRFARIGYCLLETDWTSSSKHLHHSWNSFARILPWGNSFDSRRYSWFSGLLWKWWYTYTLRSTCCDSFSVSPATGFVFRVAGMLLSYSVVKATRFTHWLSSSFWLVTTFAALSHDSVASLGFNIM